MGGKHKGEEPRLKPFAPPEQKKSQGDGDGGGGKRGGGDGDRKDGK
ncbi:hypothetical protein GCM10022224_019410 [Nonomuraea antimicrobica]|uniref:Uncharacterized protein n=1 Tax=Nonomuraea antimicrobica TaxID=561173 RepID=A0ABP7BE76_9ACTN